MGVTFEDMTAEMQPLQQAAEAAGEQQERGAQEQPSAQLKAHLEALAQRAERTFAD